jgi:hypothetical protein
MQDWKSQAAKSNTIIQDHGRCQFCLSRTENGVSDCVEAASLVTHKVDHGLGVDRMTIFLCVDAHALQHPEIHGRWNNHFHLTRLNLILREHIKWSYRFSSLLSSVVDKYKKGRDDELILPPPIGARGASTVTDVLDTSSNEEYVGIVWDWARQVYASYTNGHDIAMHISQQFREKIA